MLPPFSLSLLPPPLFFFLRQIHPVAQANPQIPMYMYTRLSPNS